MKESVSSNSTQVQPSAGVKSHRQLALIAGFGLLLMTIAIMLGQLVGLSGIVLEGDPAATVENILANQGRFRFGIFAHLIVVLLDVLVAWALYLFLRPGQEGSSLLAAWFRLVYSVILAMALVQLYSVFQLLGEGNYLSAFGVSEVQARVMLSVAAFRDTWDVGYIFFGLHLALLGLVVFRAGFVPKLWGVILSLAGVSYLIDYIGLILLPDLGLGTSFIFGWGEPLFMVWLIFWGGKADAQSGGE